MSIKNINLGKLKVIIDRELMYVSRFQFIMIAYVFFKDIGWDWRYLSFIPIWLVWIWFDLKYIMSKEITYIHSKSEILKKLNK